MADYTQSEFAAEFTLIDAPSGETLWTFAETQDAGIPNERVWTVVEAEGNLYYLSGFHYVNRVAPDLTYVVALQSFDDEREHCVTLDDDEIDD